MTRPPTRAAVINGDTENAACIDAGRCAGPDGIGRDRSRAWRFNEEKARYRLSSRTAAWSGTWQRGYSSGGGRGEAPRVLWLRALYDRLPGPAFYERHGC